VAGRPVIRVLAIVTGLGVALLGPSACNESQDDGGAVGSAVVTAPDTPTGGALASEPSPLARRILDRQLLAEYRRVGTQIGVSWPVLAAVDYVEGGSQRHSSARSTENRILAIAYTLQALNGPASYEAALAERGGERYARRVLALAQRLHSVDASAPPSAHLPLAAPAAGPVIAGYGQRYGVLHDGIDIDAATGAPLRAAATGLVVSVSDHPIFGLYTCIAHRITGGPGPRELTTCYGNQSRTLVEPGDVVREGQLIGRIGCTGTCLRPHVHFQVRLGGDDTAPAVDPAPYLAPALRAQADTSGQPLEAQP
jgi:murein DD-endopeptidase MepM/ murein hydrolase activator NlpD